MGYKYHRVFVGSHCARTVFCQNAYPRNGIVSHFRYARPRGRDLTIDLGHAKAQVSPQLYGLMTEEINSFDGGLYGELVRNRTFHDKGKIPSSWFLYESGIGDQILNADLGGRAA